MVAYSFKKQFVGPIRIGLGYPTPDLSRYNQVHLIDHGIAPKRQTIRAVGKRRHARPGETLQLYCGMRTRQCFKIGDALCAEVYPIDIIVREHSLPIKLWGDWLKDGRIHDFARADGFSSGEDMHLFWKREHGLGQFAGFLIKWEPLP